MMSSFLNKRVRDGRSAGGNMLVWTVLALLTWQCQAPRAVQADDAEKKSKPSVREGRIWNIADEPFKYRLARTRGNLWTDELTLKQGEHQTVRAPKPGEQTELEGFTGRGDGYLLEIALSGARLQARIDAAGSSYAPTAAGSP